MMVYKLSMPIDLGREEKNRVIKLNIAVAAAAIAAEELDLCGVSRMHQESRCWCREGECEPFPSISAFSTDLVINPGRWRSLLSHRPGYLP